jgi:predicted nucleic acid-binding protein
MRQFETIPLLTTPVEIWSRGVDLGRACRRSGITAGSLDLLIAAVALHHDAVILTFDEDFDQIARVSPLRVHRLMRPLA